MSSDEPVSRGDAPPGADGQNGVHLRDGSSGREQAGAVTPQDLTKPRAPGRAQSLSRRPAQQWPLLVVLGGIAVGLAFCLGEQWRLGCVIIGASLGIGAVERVALPRRNAGLLQVRSRAFDITIMLGLGAVIIALAIVVPAARP